MVDDPSDEPDAAPSTGHETELFAGTPQLAYLLSRIDVVLSRLDRMNDRLTALEAKIEEGGKRRSGPFGAGGPVLAPEYMNQPDTDASLSAARLSSELSAQKKVTEELQQRLAEKSEKSSIFTPKQLFRQFAEEIDEATEEDGTGFAIDDVEVAVTGSLGADDKGEMAMGFNLEDQVRPETATQLKFKIRRKSKARVLK